MTTSNAKKLTIQEREITMSCAKRGKNGKNNLRAQKAVGFAMLVFLTVSVLIGGELSAAVILCPLALASVFSKEKLLDFRIFGSPRGGYHSSSTSKIFPENGARDTEKLCPNRL